MVTNGYRVTNLDALVRDIFNQTAVRGGFPPVDVVEAADSYRLYAELPGRSLETISVVVEDGLLVIASSDSSDGSARANRRPFRRTFALPLDVDPAAVAARYADGILTVTLPRRPESRPRTIRVE